MARTVDRFGTMWTRWGGRPRKLADFVLTSDQFRMTYVRDASDLPGVSCLLGPRMLDGETYVRRRTEILPLPAFAWSATPPSVDARGVPSLQRRLHAGGLLDVDPSSAGGTDFDLLLLAGRDGIGHVDYFPGDAEAEGHYAEARRSRVRPRKLGTDADLWSAVSQDLSDGSGSDPDAALDAIRSLIGRSPSVGGMTPKIALSIPDEDTWDGTACASGAGRGFVEAIVKIGTDGHPGLMDLENLCFDIHRRAGIATPRTWIRTTDEGRRLLAVERFDRVDGRPVPMESLFSILSIGGRGVLSPTDGSYERVARAVTSPSAPVSTRPVEDGKELVRRLAFALLTGNGDLHLGNIAMLGDDDDRRLSPVFDPAPMRAYVRHDRVWALKPTEASRYSGTDMSSDPTEDLAEIARHCGLDGDGFREVLENALSATEGYRDLVAGLGIPTSVSGRLDVAVEAVRCRVETFARSRSTTRMGR